MQKKSLTKSKAGARALPTAMPTAAPTTATVQPVKSSPDRDEIAQRAYEIYVARGQMAGRELEDWVQAERELMGRAHRNN